MAEQGDGGAAQRGDERQQLGADIGERPQEVGCLAVVESEPLRSTQAGVLAPMSSPARSLFMCLGSNRWIPARLEAAL